MHLLPSEFTNWPHKFMMENTHRDPTLPETNIYPENRLEKEIPIGNHQFSGAMLGSGRVIPLT